MKKRIKFLSDCGPKYPKDSIVEDSEAVRTGLEAAGFNRGEHWDEVLPEENLEDVISARVSETLETKLAGAMEQAVGKVLEGVATRVEARRIEPGPEDVDKDPRRGYRQYNEFVHDVIIACAPSAGSIPENLAGIPGMERNAESIRRVSRAHAAEKAILSRAVGSDELTTLVGEYGSYLIPTEFRRELMSETLENSVMLPRVRNIPMSSQSMTIPAIDDSDHSGVTSFGGVTVYRVAERGSITVSRPKFRQIGLHLHKQAVMVPITDEMLRWSVVSVGPMLGTMSAQALAWHTDGEIIADGVGTGEPLSVTNSPCLVSVTRSVASQVNATDIDQMWQAVPQRYRGGAVWLINGDVEDDLDKLNRVVGTGGQLVYNPPAGIADAPYGRLKGRPVLVTEHCKAINTAGDILLVAPQAYLWAQLGSGPEMAASIHLRFDYHETMFRYTLYNDGRPWWNSAFTPKNGSVSYSPFVALAAG